MSVEASDLLVTMTKSELAAVVESALKRAAVVAAAEPEILDLNETAKFIGVHPRTVMGKLVRERGFPVHYLGPQVPRFRRSEILAWLSDQSREPKELTDGGS